MKCFWPFEQIRHTSTIFLSLPSHTLQHLHTHFKILRSMSRIVFCKNSIHTCLKILFMYFYREGKGRRKRQRETSMCGCLSHAPPPLGTWPATQAYALTRNQISYPPACRPVLNPLIHTSQGTFTLFDQGTEYISTVIEVIKSKQKTLKSFIVLILVMLTR